MNKKERDHRIIYEQDILTDRRRERIESAVKQRQRGLMVLMEKVLNPYNLAAIARSCDAFGVQQLAATVEQGLNPEETGHPASSSASKWLDFRLFTDGTEAALQSLKAEGWHLVATVLSERAQPIYELDFARHERVALIVGNEREGLSETAIAMADTHLIIPMQGMIQSFNVSVATAITLFEITRQRRATGQNWQLNEAEQADLLADLLQRASR